MSSNNTINLHFQTALKWFALLLILSVAAGSLSALFLVSLVWVTDFRDGHQWLIYFLPLAGLALGLLYHYKGKSVAPGNALVFEAIHSPNHHIPFKMAPFVLLGTLITHLFGGSAGREGTALQMTAAAADQLSKPFRLTAEERKILLIAALSAGFASVFGTPWAGAVFSIEVLLLRKMPYKALLPAIIAALLSTWVTAAWGVGHTHYQISILPALTFANLAYTAISGIAFAVAAVFFVRLTALSGKLFSKVKYPPLRPLVGGLVLMTLVLLLQTHKYIGLGIPQIVSAFNLQAAPQDFAFKILLTAVTLGAGFKGGEVTPLFFIGATLGSALSLLLPLPVGLLAGIGFVAVFAAAAKTPVACCIMAVELFGISCLPFVILPCMVSYFLSGAHTIYMTNKPYFSNPFKTNL